MGRKDPELTSPTVEAHRPAHLAHAASPAGKRDEGRVDPAGATVSWNPADGVPPVDSVGTPGGGLDASGKLLRRVAQFVLLERLGAGGMGVVFAAFDEKLERKVAIKLVATSGGDGRAHDRLLREAQAQARLSHPNVVTIYEVGALPEGQLFIAMELVKGETLRSWQRGGERTWQEVLARYAAAGEGLAAAHRNGIVHRDFKPDNILVGEDGRVRVADFGLAFSAEAGGELASEVGSDPASEPGKRPPTQGGRASSESGRSGRGLALTAAGTVAGTPGYMAPEQLNGEVVDARTDQFAFCVALYEALYDERPFADFVFMRQEPVQMRRSEPDPAHPRWLWSLLVRGLSLSPEARFPSMDALLAELTRNRDRGRRRLLGGATIVAVIAMTGVTAAALTLRRGEDVCPLAEAELVGIWDAATKQLVETAVLGTRTTFAANVWASTATAIDQYAKGWLSAQQLACEATNVRHVQSAELLDRRMECLAGRKRSLAAVVEVMQLRPAQAVAHASEILNSLGSIELCADTGVLLELGRGAGDGSNQARPTPEQQAKLDEARAELARARVLWATGDLAGAEADVAKASRLGESLQDATLRAELRYVEGILKLGTGDVAASIALLDQAAELAVANRHDELAADIWLFLASDTASRELRPAQIGAWLGQAEAWVKRLNHPRDPRRVVVDYARGNLQMTLGNAKEAVTTLTRSLTTAKSLWGEDALRLIPLYRDRALAYARLRQPKEAVADAERALALGLATWGPDYPDIARIRRVLGLLYIEQLGDVPRGEKEIEQARQLYVSQLGSDSLEVANCEQALSQAGLYRGDYATALEHAERADRIYLLRLGAEHPRRGEALVGVGVLRYMRKDFLGSLEAYQQAYPIQLAALGETHALGILLSNTGETLLALGRPDAARIELEKALRILESSLGPEHADLALPLKVVGLSYLGVSRFADALVPLERALALRTNSASASDPQEVAEIRWALARTLRAMRRTPGRAAELASASLATYKTLGPESATRVREISRWLKSTR